MDEDEIQALKDSIPEQFRPNADMSLRDQYAQYAYGRTIAEVMTNPERDGSEIAVAAARAGMDVVFGEEHTAIAETMRQIAHMTESLPDGHIKAIALEFPVEMQELFDPVALRDMSLGEFALRSMEIEVDGFENTIEQMLESGAINQDQFDYINGNLISGREFLARAREDPDTVLEVQGAYEPIYEMAQTAIENGTQVIAADMDRERVIGILLADSFLPDNIRMQDSDLERLLNSGVDDRSDVELLQDMGVDLSGEGVLLAHRGYHHINGHGFGEQAQTEQINGIDDILEQSGRGVLTVLIGHDYMLSDPALEMDAVPDPADITLAINYTGVAELDRSEYEAEPENEEQSPALTTSPLPSFRP